MKELGTEGTLIVGNQTYHNVDGAWLDSTEYSSLRLEKFANDTLEKLYDKYHRSNNKPEPAAEGLTWNDAVCGVSPPSNTTRRDRAGGEDEYHQPEILQSTIHETGRGFCGVLLVLGAFTTTTIVIILILSKI